MAESKVTIPDALVEIAAKIITPWAFSDHGAEHASDAARARRIACLMADGILTAVLPELARMMMEPSADMREIGSSEYYRQDLWPGDKDNPKASPSATYRAVLAAFFKEKFGIDA
jgi:hypothetical protein